MSTGVCFKMNHIMFLKNEAYISDEFSKKSDEEILSLSSSSPAFFEVLVDRYNQAFLRKAFNVIGDKEDAEDIVQETFIKIYRNANSFKAKDGASFKSWGYKILLNTSFTHYQRKKRRGEIFADFPQEFCDIIPDKDVENIKEKEILDYIASVFLRMPKNLAEVLRVHFLEGRHYKDIAAKEGITVSAIKMRVYRAKKEFKKIVFFNNL
jgi:RNA polymerase sigma-70 factor (ECF subfamily)